MARFTADDALRERAQLALACLQDPQGYDVWWLGKPGAVEQPAWFRVFPLLTTAALLSLAIAPFWPIAAFVMLFVNMGVRYATHRHIVAMAQAIRQGAPLVKTAAALAFLRGEEIEPVVGALGADVCRLKRFRFISGWVNSNPFMVSLDSNQFAIMFGDFVSVVLDYLNILFLLDGTAVYFGARDINVNAGSLLRAVAAIGEVDCALSLASYRASRQDWTRPEFQVSGPAIFTDLCHPLLVDAVPNSITLGPGRGVLVTGSNMSGKTTFLRTVGVNALLAQTVNTCLAREYKAPVFVVRSCIGRSDDLLAGKSYYIVEVEALLGLVRLSESPSPHLFLLDELFRGTNAIERIAAGQAVLQELVEAGDTRPPHVVIAATHDGELVDLLPTLYDSYHFGDAIGADGLVFDHRLQSGRATTRTAIALLRQSGAPARLLRRAETVAARLDRELIDAGPENGREPRRHGRD
ncbi:MAG: hypothetical protein ABI665_21760 [Vicinamibacterales bacterium]